MSEKEILNIHCPSCGAPARFDIVKQLYCCEYCGGKVEIETAKKEKEEFRVKRMLSLREAATQYPLETTSCSGCGAVLVFDEGVAISNCEFCGRSLVRSKYARKTEIPQSVIPMALTKKEATEKLQGWCEQNKQKPEAKQLLGKLSELKGYYLPYEMVRGPVHCKVSKSGGGTPYEAEGYLNDEFVNCSKQLDNLVLDAMEPYDLNDLAAFDFAYVAGQRVKIADVDEENLEKRLKNEVQENYRPKMEKIWGTKAIFMKTEVNPVVKLPVLLPVYYIVDGDTHAAVNGQTGKVCVRAEKTSSYIELPWWLKGIMVLLAALAITFGSLYLGMGAAEDALYITGVLGVFYLIVFACMFDSGDNKFETIKYRKIFTSGEQSYRREKGKLVLRDEVLKRKITEPVFFQQIEEQKTPVTYAFRTPKRILKMIAMGFGAIFLPVILALFLNGFNFGKLNLGGSAAWFCITVPVVPIYLIRFGIQWIYDSPWVYVFTQNGSKKRYRPKIESTKEQRKEAIKTCLGLLFVPPMCLAVWFAIISMITMVYLTAFGF